MKYIIIFHILFSFLNLLFFYKKDKQKAICVFIIILFIPILGFVFVYIPYVLRKIVKESQNILESYEDYIKKIDEHKSVLNDINVDREINLVPLSEAVDLNNNKIKRQLVIDILKQDYEQHINVLKKVLKDKDTETSHYAATGITEIKNQFQKEFLEKQKEFDKTQNLSSFIDYLEITNAYIKSALLDKTMEIEYRNIYSEVLEDFLHVYKDYKKYYVEKINVEIEIGDLEKAEIYCKEFKKFHKYNEEPYIMHMKVKYLKKEYDDFYDEIEKLTNNKNIKLSYEALEIVRFWRNEV